MSRIQDTHDIAVERGPFEMVPHWMLDSELTAQALKLYLILRRHGDANGICYPGRQRLAQAMSANVKTIDRAKAELVEAGAICFTRRHSDSGDWTSNLYHIHWERSLACTYFVATSGQKRIHGSDKNDPTPRDKNGALTNTHKEPIPKVIDRFDDFWQAYPNRKAKGAAIKAWKQAIKKTDPQTIIDAARAYAQDPKRDPAYTAHAGTWLNHERWLDEHETPKQTGPVTVMDLYADEPCVHGDPMGEAKCPLCRRQ